MTAIEFLKNPKKSTFSGGIFWGLNEEGNFLFIYTLAVFTITYQIKLKIQKNSIILESNDNIILGNICNIIKNCRSIDVYKAKGFFFRNDKIKLKPVKKK